MASDFINKADGDNLERARLAQAQFRSALRLFPKAASGWDPEVLTYSGYFELGIPEIWDMIDRYFAFVDKNGYFERRRAEQSRYWMYETIDEQLRASFYNDPEIEHQLAEGERLVLANRQTSFAAARHVLDYYFSRSHRTVSD